MKTSFACVLLVIVCLTACNDSIDVHLAKERTLEMQITTLEHKVKVLQDSLLMYTAADTDAVTQNTSVKRKSVKESNVVDPSEPSLYKNIVFHHEHIYQSSNGTPGFFPEGSERLLFTKDVLYLSEWGLQIMQNEIYARHGMIFSNPKLSNHFKQQPWYKGTTFSVSNRLSTTELQNIEFLKTYKYTPDSQNNTKNLNSNIPQVD